MDRTADRRTGARIVRAAARARRRRARATGRSATGDPGPVLDGAEVPAGQLLRWLPPQEFPANRDLLVDSATAHRAPSWVVDALGRLPAAQVFQGVEQLAAALSRQRHVHVVARRTPRR